jgi:hypothetical protein
MSSGGHSTLVDAPTVPGAVAQALDAYASRSRWVAATVGSESAAGYELATDKAVMAIGGYNGTDPTPTLAQFETWVAQGEIHFFILGGTGISANRPGARRLTSSEITSWVEANFTAVTVDGTTLYDLGADVPSAAR